MPASQQSTNAEPADVRVAIGHASIHCISYRQAVERVLTLAKARTSAYVVTPNVDHIVMLEDDPALRDAYAGAALVTCDSTPLRWFARLLGTPIVERVTGSDLMPGICKAGAAHGLTVAIVGGPPGRAEAAGRILTERYPGLRVVMTCCPPLGFDRDPEASRRLVDTLNEAAPAVVFVGVGAPKQELWIARHRASLRVGVLLGVGASIEFVAGTLPRAPKWMRKSGLEWLRRLAADPRRLVFRYAKDLRIFIIVARQLLSRRRP